MYIFLEVELLSNAIASFYVGILCNLYVFIYVMLETNIQYGKYTF